MSATQRIIAGLIIAIATWLIAPQVYRDFPALRIKLVRNAVPSTLGRVEVSIPSESPVDRLQPPYAAAVRLRNDGATPIIVRIQLDGVDVCSVEIPPRGVYRRDCAVRNTRTATTPHKAEFVSTAPGFTLEALELSTHHGAISAGPSNLILVPRGFAAFQPTGVRGLLLVLALMTLTAASFAPGFLPRGLSHAHHALSAVIGLLIALVIAVRFVSDYSVLVEDTFLARLLFITALPAIAKVTISVIRRLDWPNVHPHVRATATGLVVGVVFLSFASTRINESYGGNPSGLLLVSQRLFDRHPILANRDDVRRSLRLSPDGGYDGQFFYFMSFDPFLSRFRKDPERYKEFIDFPPYRYGRIGFSLLTDVVSGDRATLYPLAMVALVLGSLAMCAVLLSTLAQRHRLPAWYGGLILLIPGFWQSVEGTMPEPLAIAFILAGYLLAHDEHWWACGFSLGVSMLIRETSGALVLALPAGLLLSGRRREGLLVALIALAPLVAWKLFVGSVFFGAYGLNAFMPHPGDFGPPFAGVWHVWRLVAAGTYYDGMPEMLRAGALFPILVISAVALAAAYFAWRPRPESAAGCIYAVLTVFFNYDAVWLGIGNAQRLTIDLFAALALIFATQVPERRIMTNLTATFWSASALYLCFGTFDAATIRHGGFGWLVKSVELVHRTITFF